MRSASSQFLAGPLLRFTVSGLIALILVGAGTAYVSRRVGTTEAIREATDDRALIWPRGTLPELVA